MIAVLVAGGPIGGTTVDGAQLVTSYGFIPWPRADGRLNPILSQGWTLNYEAFFYAAFALALLFRRGVAALCAAFLALAALHPFIPPSLFVLWFWSNPVILEFLGGMALARLYLTGYRLPLAGSLLLAVAAVLVYAATAGLQLGFIGGSVHVGLPALLLCAALILAPEPARPGPLRRLLQLGGDASYTIYLAHYMIINVVVLVWVRLGLDLPWLGVAVGLAASIGGAMIFYLLAERPFTEALQRKVAGRPPNKLDSVAP